MSIECREKKARCQLVSTASSPLNPKELIDSAPLVISYALHALIYLIALLYTTKKKCKGKKNKLKQSSPLNKDGALPL